jgi:hypothetical protein
VRISQTQALLRPGWKTAGPVGATILHPPNALGESLADWAFIIDVKLKLDAASQLRDNLEHYISGPIYPAFLKKLIPIFKKCLDTPPNFISTSLEQVRPLEKIYSPDSDLFPRNCGIVFSKYCTGYPRTPPKHSSHMRKKWWIS